MHTFAMQVNINLILSASLFILRSLGQKEHIEWLKWGYNAAGHICCLRANFPKGRILSLRRLSRKIILNQQECIFRYKHIYTPLPCPNKNMSLWQNLVGHLSKTNNLMATLDTHTKLIILYNGCTDMPLNQWAGLVLLADVC